MPNFSEASSPLSVLIVGAGIAGLTTAIECHRRGMSVRLIERSPSFSAIGDGFGAGPSAFSTLHHYPKLVEGIKAASYDATFSLHQASGQRIMGPVEAFWNAPGAEHPSKAFRPPWINFRAPFCRALLDQVERDGIAIQWAKSVVEYNEDLNAEKVTVKTKDGEVFEADIVVAADGIGTKSHGVVTGKTVREQSSGYSCYRAAIPTGVVLSDEKLQERIGWHVGDRPEFRVYFGEDMHLNLILTDDMVMLLLTHKDENDQSLEDWHNIVPTSTVLKTFRECPGWSPDIEQILASVPEDGGYYIDWKLLWRDPQPKWVSDGGRIVQLGDSAHSFLPTSGNGATQAMEDAISLATCLQLGGKQDAMKATKVHALLRFERVSTLQKFGFVTRQEFHKVGALDSDNVGTKIRMGSWIWGHNPEAYAEKMYNEALESVVNGASFANRNLPPGYTYKPWTIASEMEKEQKGELSDLKEDGDWS